MGYLDDYVNKATKLRVKKRPKSIGKIIYLIRSGRYDPANPTHVHMKNVAMDHGYIDREMNIVKEP